MTHVAARVIAAVEQAPTHRTTGARARAAFLLQGLLVAVAGPRRCKRRARCTLQPVNRQCQ